MSAMNRNQAVAFAKDARESGKVVVFTNGCFDLLHPGHFFALERARGEGDVLIVGLNSDQSVRRLKGEERPIVDEDARVARVAALSCVDGVVLFDEDTPADLIAALEPDVLVKGKEWAGNVAGADTVLARGGRIVLLSRLPHHSTSAIADALVALK